MLIKHGQVWINTGFEAAYKTKFYHAVVRVLKVEGDIITVRSLSDTAFGRFSYGTYPNEPFTLCRHKNFISGHFRPYKTGDLKRLLKDRIVNTVLYAR